MSRLLVLIVAALALVTAACGGQEAREAAAPTVSAPDREVAGWSAPPALPGSRTGRLSEPFRDGAALQRWGYLEGDGGRNRFRVRDGRLEILPADSAWDGARRGFYLYRAVRGDFDVRARMTATAQAGLLVRAAPAGAMDPENWLALREGDVASTQGSRTRVSRRRPAAGWTRLRVRREDSRFSLLERRGRRWKRVGSTVRADLPRTVQVGIAAAGTGRAVVDDVRFR